MSNDLVKTVCKERDLCVFHIGFRGQELRVYLRALDADRPMYVVELHGVHSFFDRGIGNGQPVLLDAVPGVGSFGWYLDAEERSRHIEVFLRLKADPIVNPFRAIVQRVVEREVTDPGEAAWPG